MKKAVIILSAIALLGCNQTAKNKPIQEMDSETIDTDTIVTEVADTIVRDKTIVLDDIAVIDTIVEIEEVPILHLIILDEYTETKRPPKPLSKHIYVESSGHSEIQNTVYVFYYTPEMENSDYPFQQRLGSDNNFAGATDIDGKAYISIPDTLTYGAKLMFRSIGYEPYEISADTLSNQSHIKIELTPKIYTSIVVLDDKKQERKFSILYEIANRAFWGDCKPIYLGNGNHADPICAFDCLAHCYPLIVGVPTVLENAKKDVKKLYKALKKGEKCSFLCLADHSKITVEPEELPHKIKLTDLKKAFLNEDDLRIRSRDTHTFQLRLIFTTKSNLKNLLNEMPDKKFE
jgi:hypothetical protein